MTKVIRFSGHSDDIFECEIRVDGGRDSGDEYYPGNEQPIWLLVCDMATPENERHEVIVSGEYGDYPSGGWRISLSSTVDSAESVQTPPPGWDVRFEASDATYSPCLVLTVPDTVEVSVVDKKGRVRPKNSEEEKNLVDELRDEVDLLKRALNEARKSVEGTNTVVRRLAEGGWKKAR